VTPRRAAALLVLLLCAVFCLTQLAEVDFFWHLLAGRSILETGRVPRVDDFTWTSAGRPWVDLHWLFQAGVAAVWRIFGWRGLDALKVGLVVAGFAAALVAAQRRRASLAGPLLLLPGIVAAQERFTLRPEAASFLLLGGLLVILSLRRERPRLVLTIPLVVALWANVPSLYAAGVALVLLTLAGDAIDAVIASRAGRHGDGAGHDPVAPRARRHALRMLCLAAGLSIPASLLTPYGLAAWKLPGVLLFQRIAASNLYGRSIAEFQAPFSGFGATAAVTAFALYAVAVAIAMISGRRACGAADVLVVAAFLGLALLARRNIPLFVLAALPSAAPAATLAWERAAAALAARGGVGCRAASLLPAVAAAAACVLALLLIGDVVSNRFFARDGTQRYFGTGVAPGFYPESAAEFVTAAGLPDKVLNDMTMGGYLAWRWYPGRRVFIDGRLEVHDPSLFAESLRMQQDPALFESEARARGIRTVLWSHRQALDAAPLLRHLAGGNGWRLVHVDLAAAVFVRDDDATREAGADGATPTLPAAIDLDRDPPVARLLKEAEQAADRTRAADPVPAWFRRYLPRVEVPAAEVGCALFFALIDRSAPSISLFTDAARRAPWSAVLRYDLGLALVQAKRTGEARAALEEALRLDPGFAEAWAALATLRLVGGDEEGALAAWDRAGRAGGLPASAYRSRGSLLARRGRIDAAIDDYRRALAAEPGRAVWRAELASLYSRRGMADAARAEVQRAIATDPGACLPRVTAAMILRAAGDPEAALSMAMQATQSATPCPEASLETARLLAEAGRDAEAAREVSEALRLGADPSVVAADPLLRGLVPQR
jgi:tetratricopeptide (TPR) repeat protein